MMRTRTAVMLLLFAAASILEQHAVSQRPARFSGAEVSSVYALAGEFRTVAAKLLWIRADRYHHEFISRDPDWAKDEDLLGLILLITRLDPRFTEAYASGAVMYAYGFNNPERAVQFLEEGIRHSPQSWDLHETAAIIYARKLNKPDIALQHARIAYSLSRDSFKRRNLRRLVRTLEDMASESDRNKSQSKQ